MNLLKNMGAKVADLTPNNDASKAIVPEIVRTNEEFFIKEWESMSGCISRTLGIFCISLR
ncbi:hypothetical protein D3C78_1943620 [compost metagenome]